ncbi:hypothetical protein ADICEAN_00216 [Cesiribacter andamanensis AMV16]|uniref:Uncharacterized protein n=1 Tax=Cesiribacter andamanensis AMV16 TaxID=1279009 RepID=M7P203_9BACT|nr:hypothetical protein ADICEAN_00216 [Cesiribacter andamanensis AMV16]
MARQNKILYLMIRRMADLVGLVLLLAALLFALRG